MEVAISARDLTLVRPATKVPKRNGRRNGGWANQTEPR